MKCLHEKDLWANSKTKKMIINSERKLFVGIFFRKNIVIFITETRDFMPGAYLSVMWKMKVIERL